MKLKLWPPQSPMFLLLLLLLMPWSQEAFGETHSTAVVYVDGSKHVYFDQGRDAGLNPGMILRLNRRGRAVGTVEVLAASAGRSTAKIIRFSRHLRPGDVALYDGIEPEEAPLPERELTLPVPFEKGNAAPWKTALLSSKRDLVAYDSKGAPRRPSFRAGGEMQWVSRAYRSAPHLQRNEQHISLWSQGTDLGIKGLSLRLRGDVIIRYNGGPYLFRTEQATIQSLREVALSYDFHDDYKVSAGRFKPKVRMAGTLDGAQVSWQKDQLSITAFGGLRPELTTLNPSLDAPAFGTQVSFRSDADREEPWRVSLAYLGEGGDSFHHRLAIDSSLGSQNHRVWQQATIRLPNSQYDGGVSLVSVQGQWGDRKGVHVDGSARYIDQFIYTVDVVPQTQKWIEAVGGQAKGRADLSITLPRSDEKTWKPYVYWDQQLLENREDTFVVAAGMSKLSARKKGRTLKLLGDYGDGTRQQVRFGFTLTTPPRRFGVAMGTLHQWTHSHLSDLKTLQHMGHATMTYTGDSPFDFWLAVQGVADHDLYIIKARGVWGSGRLGVSYEW